MGNVFDVTKASDGCYRTFFLKEICNIKLIPTLFFFFFFFFFFLTSFEYLYTVPSVSDASG